MKKERYPDASTAYWHQKTHPGAPMDVNAVVLHTTEGTSLPSYQGGSTAPTLTAVPDMTSRTLTWYQHFDIDVSSRALVNLKGGVETNTLNICQVELVGTCDPKTHKAWDKAGRGHVYWPGAPEWAMREVGKFLAWMNTEHGVPLRAPAHWPAYPSSYGNTGARMSPKEWNAFHGVCGHLHVPENQHGDPGAVNITALLSYAGEYALKGGPSTQTSGRAPVPAEKPQVSLSRSVAAARKDPAREGHPVVYSGVKTIESALVAEKLLAKKWADGHFGTKTIEAYAKWQRRCGFKGRDADGVPGSKSLTSLGRKHGFEVTS